MAVLQALACASGCFKPHPQRKRRPARFDIAAQPLAQRAQKLLPHMLAG